MLDNKASPANPLANAAVETHRGGSRSSPWGMTSSIVASSKIPTNVAKTAPCTTLLAPRSPKYPIIALNNAGMSRAMDNANLRALGTPSSRRFAVAANPPGMFAIDCVAAKRKPSWAPTADPEPTINPSLMRSVATARKTIQAPILPVLWSKPKSPPDTGNENRHTCTSQKSNNDQPHWRRAQHAWHDIDADQSYRNARCGMKRGRRQATSAYETPSAIRLPMTIPMVGSVAKSNTSGTPSIRKRL